mmetsp:Transcript_13238/g.37104  ORF Transcript_13238/g.37104 Transcript_13238/m.37104 type:complete len:204 (-) Transcript_13238:47-658(-)
MDHAASVDSLSGPFPRFALFGNVFIFTPRPFLSFPSLSLLSKQSGLQHEPSQASLTPTESPGDGAPFRLTPRVGHPTAPLSSPLLPLMVTSLSSQSRLCSSITRFGRQTSQATTQSKDRDDTYPVLPLLSPPPPLSPSPSSSLLPLSPSDDDDGILLLRFQAPSSKRITGQARYQTKARDVSFRLVTLSSTPTPPCATHETIT